MQKDSIERDDMPLSRERLPTVTVIGLGRVGLPTAAIFAFKGCHVIGVDIDEEKVRNIKRGHLYIDEPHLSTVLKMALSNKLLEVTVEGINAIRESQAVLLCVPTPIKKKIDQST